MTSPDANTRKSLWKALLPPAVILAVVFTGLVIIKAKVAKPPAASPTQEVAVGATLPDLKLKVFRGKDVTLSQLPGKVLLINFWATWCEACTEEFPTILKLHDQFKDKGLEVVAINLDDNPDQVLPRAIPKMKIDFPVYTDANGDVASIFDVRAIPLTVIADRQRKILLVDNGERDWSAPDIHAKMEQWLTQ